MKAKHLRKIAQLDCNNTLWQLIIVASKGTYCYYTKKLSGITKEELEVLGYKVKQYKGLTYDGYSISWEKN